MNDPELYHDRYRVPSIRLPFYDYRECGWYFVTICTNPRLPWFGTVRNGMMGLSDVGCVVADEWQKTAMIRKNIFLDSWVVMPDHIHGIIVIDEIRHTTAVETARRAVSTRVVKTVTLPILRAGSLGAIVGRFKYACTKRIRSMGYTDFAWQTRFHESILWDETSVSRVRRYIRLNPPRWNNDKNVRFG